MLTLERFNNRPIDVPPSTVWYLADVAEARGKQEPWSRQYPQRLKTLREHAMIESAVSSNRIEGVTIDQARVKSVVLGNQPLRDRNEAEVRGYRNALRLIHERVAELPVSVDTIRRLHAISRAEEPDGGRYREHAMDIIETHADGSRRVRFSAIDAARVLAAMEDLVQQWDTCLRERSCHPLVALAVMNLDFLCIHPFHDGNGRVSRLLWLLQSRISRSESAQPVRREARSAASSWRQSIVRPVHSRLRGCRRSVPVSAWISSGRRWEGSGTVAAWSAWVGAGRPSGAGPHL